MSDLLTYGIYPLIALFLGWLLWLNWLAPVMAGVKTIGIDDYRGYLNRQHHLLLDVRGEDEYVKDHAPRSRNLPLQELARMSREDLRKLSQGKPVVCICNTANRSRMAATALARAGVGPVYYLKGGMIAWRSSNMPLEKGSHGK